MGLTLLMESMATAASVGMGCGTCCGSSVTTALYGYLTTHTGGMKPCLKAFLDFFLGKLLAVIGLCCLAALLGREILSGDGRLLGLPLSLAVDLGMIGIGLWLLYRWFQERSGLHRCGHSEGCEGNPIPMPTSEKPSRIVLLGMGASYGISPCAPLLLVTGYAATLPVGCAIALGGVFATASSLSPALLLLALTGVLAGRMRKEIPRYLTWFRLGSYLLLILLFSIRLIKEVLSL